MNKQTNKGDRKQTKASPFFSTLYSVQTEAMLQIYETAPITRDREIQPFSPLFPSKHLPLLPIFLASWPLVVLFLSISA